MPSRLPESLAVLRDRDYRLLFAGQAASLLGDGMVSVALAFATLELGGSGSDVGLVLASRMIPLVACLLVGGVVADRVSRRAVMVAADCARLVSQGTMAVLLISGGAEVWMLAVLAGVTGAGTGFFNPAATGLLPSVVAPERLQQANGLRATAQATGEIAGPAVAGVLVATAGAGWAIAIDAASFAISAVLLAGLRVRPRDARASSRFVRDLKDGWTAFTARTWVWAFVAGAALGNLCWGAWSALGPVIADRELGGATAWGTVLSAMGAGGLVGGILAVRTAPRRPLLLASALGPVFALPLAILAVGAPPAVLAVTTFGAGAALMFSNTIWESTLQRHVPVESLSRVSAYDWFGSLAFYPLGLAIWGPVSEAIGVSRSLWLSFGLQLAIAGALLSVADIRRLGSGASSSST